MQDANEQTATFINPAIVITIAIITSIPLTKSPILIKDTASNEGKVLEDKPGNPNISIFLIMTLKSVRPPDILPLNIL